MTSMITEIALALSRWIELSILGKATIIIVLGLTAVRLAGRARASVRHLLLTSTFGMLIALPFIVFTVPALTIQLPSPIADESTTTSTAVIPLDTLITPTSNSTVPQTPNNNSWSLPSWPTVIRSVWIAGLLLLLSSLAVNLWRLRRICRHGLPWPEKLEFTQSLAAECGVRRPVEVLMHEDIQAPLTCGVYHPVILLPADANEWSESDLRRALVHELEHVRRGDWAIQLVVRVTCACYWFHPLIWVALRRLCLEAERACDDAVIRNAEQTEYAEQLVLLARRLSHQHTQAVLGMANRSDLSTRVTALLDGGQQRGRAGLLSATSVMIIASIVVFSIAPLRAVARATNRGATTAQEREFYRRVFERIEKLPGVQSAAAINSSTQQSDNERRRRPSPLDRALYDAAESGETSEIEQLLNAGANVNCALAGDGSPLIGAAREGRLVAVRLLLDRGADPNMPVSGDGNPLIMAAREGHVEIVTLLLDRGARIDEMVPSDENALIQASWNGRLQVVKLLVERGANVNARIWVERSSPQTTGEWRTPLSMARRGGHDAVVAFLIAAGAQE